MSTVSGGEVSIIGHVILNFLSLEQLGGNSYKVAENFLLCLAIIVSPGKVEISP